MRRHVAAQNLGGYDGLDFLCDEIIIIAQANIKLLNLLDCGLTAQLQDQRKASTFQGVFLRNLV